MEPITRDEARSLGQTWFYTGLPCRKGHVAKRWTRNNACAECQIERTRAWIQRNRERRQKQLRAWRESNQDYPAAWRDANRERLRELGRAYRAADPHRHHEHRKKWRLANPEIQRAATRNWYRANPEYNREKDASRGRVERSPISIFYRDAVLAFYRACPAGLEVDHIVPIKGKLVTGLHVPWNLQYLPRSENIRKGNR